MRLLLIAPDFGDGPIRTQQQALMRDIQALEIQATFLQGAVTRADVLRELRTGRYDILMAMTHGYAQGLQLAPGSWLEPAQMGTLSRYGVGVVMLLACDSVVVGQVIMQAAGVDVICHVAGLDSEDAYMTGSLFVKGLADGLSHRQAYEQAKPATGAEFVYLTASATLPPWQQRTAPPTGTVWDEHAKRLDAHDVLFAQREQDETKTIALINELMRQINRRMDNFEKRVLEQIRQELSSTVRLNGQHKIAFFLAFLLLFMPVPLFFTQLREFFGVSWQAALVFALTSYFISGTLWLYMWWGGRP